MTRYWKCDSGMLQFPLLYVDNGDIRPCSTCELVDRAEYEALVREQFAAEHNELVGRMRHQLDREPQPEDGPEYHHDHAAWERRNAVPYPKAEEPQ